MNDQLKSMTADVAKGLMTRREFVGRAAALGVTAAVANTMLAERAAADGHGTPIRGGMMKIGSSGGESTNTQDPALTASEVPLNNLRAWGETLVEVTPEGEITSEPEPELLFPDFRAPDGSYGTPDKRAYARKLRKAGRTAASARKEAQTFSERVAMMRLKVIAGILDVPLDDLLQREQLYQSKRRKAAEREGMWLIAAILASPLLIAATFEFNDAQRKARFSDLDPNAPLTQFADLIYAQMKIDTIVTSFFIGAGQLTIITLLVRKKLGAIHVMGAIAGFLFAVSTMISWSYYGQMAWSYLFGEATVNVYKALFLICGFIGTVINLQLVLEFSDILLLAMSIPNLLGCFLLSGVVAGELENYMARLSSGEMLENLVEAREPALK